MKYQNLAINLKSLCLYHKGQYDLMTIIKFLNIDIVFSTKFNEVLTIIDNTIFINSQIDKGKYYYLEFAKSIAKIYLNNKNKKYNEDNIEDFAIELIVGKKELKHFYGIYQNYPKLDLFVKFFNLPEDILIKELQKMQLKIFY